MDLQWRVVVVLRLYTYSTPMTNIVRQCTVGVYECTNVRWEVEHDAMPNIPLLYRTELLGRLEADASQAARKGKLLRQRTRRRIHRFYL